MNAYVGCVGCEQRQLDATRVVEFFRANGAAMVDNPRDADVLVLVTCAVDGRNEEASTEALRTLALAKRPEARLIVGGCMPDISPHRLSVAPVAGTFSPRSLDRLDRMMGEVVTTPMSRVADANSTLQKSRLESTTGPASPRETYDRAKQGFTIRVNHGCLLKCSYCVIRLATGELESIPVESIEEQYHEAQHRREPTVMLVGGDTGAYGRDIGVNLPGLLRRLLTHEGEQRLFVHDLNANWYLRDLSDYAALFDGDCHRLQALCIPVQSGSDRILRSMRRPYRANDVLRGIRLARSLAPHVELGTHIIAGFPGETPEDFQQTLQFLEECQFDFLTCFRYSEHPSAPSSNLTPKVPEELQFARLDKLREQFGRAATILS